MTVPAWRARYETRLTSATEAVRAVKSGDRVFVHGSAANPVELLEALVQRADELEGVRLVHLHAEGPAPHGAPGLERSFRHEAAPETEFSPHLGAVSLPSVTNKHDRLLNGREHLVR